VGEAEDAAGLRQKVSSLEGALAQMASQHQRATAQLQQDLGALRREAVRLRSRCREEEERANTVSEVADVLKERMEELTLQKERDGAELGDLRRRLDRLTAREAEEASSVQQLAAWEHEVRNVSSRALELLAQRGVELRVRDAVRRSAAADDRGAPLCKICYEREIGCALLPCKHNAFCRDCARQVVGRHQKCPICRRAVSDILETFLG